jgi:hypothetical protein
MELAAYLLAADPAWIEASVLSYYGIVSRIVVSYDENGRGWTGTSVDVDQCLRRLRAIDRDSKMDFRPGHYARTEYPPMENETYQRQTALSECGGTGEWVLQLDTDEILGSTDEFMDCIEDATRKGRTALNYPSIYLYAHAGGRWYLEWSRRGWKRAAGYPGPLAIRPDSRFCGARRTESRYFHVDLSRAGSPSRVPAEISVDRIVSSAAAVWHFSTVRDEAWLRRKYASWGHAQDRDWHPEVEKWLKSIRKPLWSSITSQFQRGNEKRHLKLAHIPKTVSDLIADSCVSEANAPKGIALMDSPQQTV